MMNDMIEAVATRLFASLVLCGVLLLAVRNAAELLP
jgi:hypothetical protein